MSIPVSLLLLPRFDSVHAIILLPESIAQLNDWEPVGLVSMPPVVMLKVPESVLMEPSDAIAEGAENEPSEPIVNGPLLHKGPGDSKELISHVPAKSAIEYDAASLVRMPIPVLLPPSVHAIILLPESIAQLNDWLPVAVMMPAVVILRVPESVLMEPSDAIAEGAENEPSEPIIHGPLLQNGPGDSK
jgi:hypothetical protein